MKRFRAVVPLLLLLLLPLSGCCLQHEWAEATCHIPKTCIKCGKTTGAPLGHRWVEASCSEARVCSACGQTEGEPLGHDWLEPTCTEPKTCSRCGMTEGSPIEHEWADATCTEPASCIHCGTEKGKALGHRWLSADFEHGRHCSVCGFEEGEPLSHEDDAQRLLGSWEGELSCGEEYRHFFEKATHGLFSSEELAGMDLSSLTRRVVLTFREDGSAELTYPTDGTEALCERFADLLCGTVTALLEKNVESAARDQGISVDIYLEMLHAEKVEDLLLSKGIDRDSERRAFLQNIGGSAEKTFTAGGYSVSDMVLRFTDGSLFYAEGEDETRYDFDGTVLILLGREDGDARFPLVLTRTEE